MIRRGLPLLAFLVMVAFWPWWEGGGLSPRWGVIAIGAPLLLFAVRIRPTPLHWLGAALLAWATLSLLWTPVPVTGFAELARMVLGYAVFCVAAEIEDMRPTYVAIAAGVAISGGIAILQVFGWEDVPQLNVPAGLFVNRNYLAEIGLLALILAVGLRQWWAVPLTACAALLPHSRGVMVALAAVILLWVWQRSRTTALLFVAASALAGYFVLAVPGVPALLRDSSSLDERLTIWRPAIEHFTLAGHGAGSFFVVFPTFMPHKLLLETRPAHAHNELINEVSDLGLPGFVLLAGFFGFALRHARELERLVLAAVLVIGLFSFPLHLPASGFVAALVAGAAARQWRLVHGCHVGERAIGGRGHGASWHGLHHPA